MKALVAILAAVLSVLLMTFAHGADLRTPYKAPPLPPIVDLYSGFYIGGAIGYGWDRGNLGASLPRGPADFGDLSNSPQGFLGGGYLGYGQRIPGFLGGLGLDAFLGAEAMGLFGNLSGTAAMPINPLVSTTNDRWLARTVGRFGLIYQNVMFFGDAGWGWGGTVLDITCGTACGPAMPAGTNIGSSSKTDSGFTWGAGIEFPWFFGPQWKGRFQYAQFDFGTNAACILATCTTPTPIMATQRNRVDAVLGGLNLKF